MKVSRISSCHSPYIIHKLNTEFYDIIVKYIRRHTKVIDDIVALATFGSCSYSFRHIYRKKLNENQKIRWFNLYFI